MTIIRVIRNLLPSVASGGGGTSAIETAAAGLVAGDDIVLTGVTWTGGDVPVDDDFNWNNKGHCDPVRRRLYFATKNAGDNVAMQHCVYEFDANTFHCENCGFNHQGHVYDSVAYDHADGKAYLVPGGGQGSLIYETTPTNTSPGTLVSTGKDANDEIAGIMYAGSGWFVSSEGAMDIHPNLFGAGAAGLVIVCKRGLGAWRKSTNVFSVILGTGTFDNCNIPTVVYSRGLGACILTTNINSNAAYRVVSSSSVIQINDTPIAFGPDQGTTVSASVCDDPNEGATVYALEKLNNGRVWKYSAGTWALQSGVTHPFHGDGDEEDWVIIAGYGLALPGRCPIIAIERTTSGNPRIRLWRPDT